MFGIESARRLCESVAFQFQPFTNCGPLLLLPHNSRPYSGQTAIIRMPNSRRREAIVGLTVQVKNRRMGILAAGVMKMNAHMRLVGTLVWREPDVAINAEQGTACGPVGEEEWAQLAEVRCKTIDEH